MLLTVAAVAAALMTALATALALMLIHARQQNAALLQENDAFRRRSALLQDAEAEAARIRGEAEARAAAAREAADAEEERRAAASAESLELTGRLTTLREEVASLEEHARLQGVGVYAVHYPEHTPERFRQEEEWLRSLQAMMLREKTAARCEAEPGSPACGAVDSVVVMMLRAFNAECDAALARVDRGNLPVMEARVEKAFETLNRMGSGHQCQLSQRYRDLKIQQLHLTCEYRAALRQSESRTA